MGNELIPIRSSPVLTFDEFLTEQLFVEASLCLIAQRILKASQDHEEAIPGICSLRDNACEVGSLARLNIADDQPLSGDHPSILRIGQALHDVTGALVEESYVLCTPLLPLGEVPP